MKIIKTLFLFLFVVCASHGALVIDVEESLFLGKEIGQLYQCSEWLSTTKLKLYNINDPNNYIIIDINDKNYNVKFIPNNFSSRD